MVKNKVSVADAERFHNFLSVLVRNNKYIFLDDDFILLPHHYRLIISCTHNVYIQGANGRRYRVKNNGFCLSFSIDKLLS